MRSYYYPHFTWTSFYSSQYFYNLAQALCCLATLIILSFACATSFPAFASSSGVSVSPAFSQIELEEGSEKSEFDVEIINNTDRFVDFVLQAVDISQMDSEGNVQLIEKPVEGNALSFAQYIQIQPDNVTLAANSTEKIHVEIRNTQDLSPGGHYAAVLLKGTGTKASNGQTVIPALTSFVLVNKKGGERYAFSLTKVEAFSKALLFSLPDTATLRFQNSGNTHMTPFGTIQLTDVFGRTVRDAVLNEGAKIVLPQSDRSIPVTLHRVAPALPIMFYTARIQGHTVPGNSTFTQSTSFIYISPVWSLLVLVGLGCLVFWIARIRRRKR